MNRFSFLLVIFFFLLPVYSLIEYCEVDSRVDIEETVVDSKVEELRWIGSKTSGWTLFARTLNGHLYRSTDEGRTWTDQLDVLKQARGSTTATVKDFVVDSTLRTVYIWNDNGDLWVTQNYGSSYSYTNTTLFFDESPKIHPDRADTAIARVKSPGCKNRGICFYQLYSTTNYGQTWTLVQNYIRSYAWGYENKFWFDSQISPSGNQAWDGWYYNIYSSIADQSSVTQVADHIGGFVMKFNALFIAQLIEESKQDLRLLIARNLGEAPLITANIPADLRQARYSIMDTTENLVFVNVEHGDSDWGNLYVSDNTENNFALSLEKNKRDVYGHVDFGKMNGLNGIYLANTIENGFYSDDEYITTKTTFDNGGRWSYLTPPVRDYKNETINCRSCTLHLNGIHKEAGEGVSDTSIPFGPFYTNQNAIGLVLGTGNVGLYLSDEIAEMRTYFSRDAGSSWEEIKNGSYIYEYADHGSIIVMAENTQETDRILYTWNQFLNYTECKFTDSAGKLRIQDIHAEPTTTGLTFVIRGTKTQQGSVKGVLVHLDFFNLQPRQCESSDYESWSPSDTPGGSCLLGKTVYYTRRKRGANCYNGQDYEIQTEGRTCPCTIEDYECDYCYEPYSDGSCVLTCEEDPSTPPENCDGYYYVSQGWRLVEGTSCDPTHGLNLLPVKVQCPTKPSNNTDTSGFEQKTVAIAAVSVLGVVVFILGVFIVLVLKNNRVRGLVLKATGRLPNGGSDPFGSVPFLGLNTDAEDDDDLGNEPKELNDSDIKQVVKTDSDDE